MIDTPTGRYVLYLRERLQVVADQDRDAAYAEDAVRKAESAKTQMAATYAFQIRALQAKLAALLAS